LVATPMPRHYYLLSFLLARLPLLAVEAGALLGFGALVFQVPLRGSLFVLATLCVLGSLSFSALALLIASRVQTTEAVSGLMNLAMIPMWIVSGVFFSAQRFPDTLQPVIQALPLTAVIDALRANMLQGAGFPQIAPQMGILAGWLIVSTALALTLFRWR
jgi:ABC-2 type transport system permease protein